MLVALGGACERSSRYWAMAEYLSGAEGWRDAGAMLGGNFATVEQAVTVDKSAGGPR